MKFLLLLLTPQIFAYSPIDFSQYRIGFNNRALFETILRDLTTEFGQPVTTAYGNSLQAKKNQIVIDESQIDTYLKETHNPKEREAIARFILAHEYFHVLLKHTHIRDSVRVPREIEIKGTFSEARKQMERQVDYLAAKHLHRLGLPTEAVQKMFLNHPELHGGTEYPTAKERARIVDLAKDPGIDERYFDHEVLKCVSLLSELRTKLP